MKELGEKGVFKEIIPLVCPKACAKIYRMFCWTVCLAVCLVAISHQNAFARLERLSDATMASITGQGAVDFSFLGSDTARFFFDVHAEIYAEVDSVKLGYYNRQDHTTRKFLSPDDPNYNGETPYSDDNSYQYYYYDGSYVSGRQGKDLNVNNMDWDINIENLRIGTSPSEPMVIDGLVVHLKYDDINSPTKRLTDIIIGSNSMEGDFYGDMKRITGYVNTKLPQTPRDANLNNLVQALNGQSTPMSLNRDSFLMLADHYRAEYGSTVNPPVPEDPTNNNISTGMFLRIGLDPSSSHFGYALIAGYNEIVANAYEPANKMIKAAITDWWDK